MKKTELTPAELLAKKKDAEGRIKSLKSVNVAPKWKCLLSNLRIELGLSQDDVAKAVGLSKTTIWETEHGQEILLTNAVKLARFFGRSVEQIWQEVT